MATHSIVLACRIPGTEEPGGLPSMGWHRAGQDWSDLAAAAAVVSESRSVVSDFVRPNGLYSPWNSDQDTGVGSHSLLQGIFPTQGLNPGLPHCRQILYQLSHKGSPRILEWVAFPTQESNQVLLRCRRILYQLSYQGSLPSKCPIHINSLFFLFLSVQFSCSVVSNSLQLHGLQHPRLPCPSPTPRFCSNSCSLSWWCHPIISSSVIPFSSCLQSFPASESFPMSQFFASGGQSIGASASASVLPVNIQEWFPLGFDLKFDLTVQGTFKSLLQYHSSKASILWCLAFFMVQLTSIRDYWKNHSFDCVDLCWQSDVSAF